MIEILGVISGLIGTAATAFINLKAQKLKNEHDIALIKAQSDALVVETNANIKVTETQVAGEIDKRETEAFIESIKTATTPSLDNKILEKLFNNKWTMWIGVLLSFLLGFVDFLKGVMRPGLTAYLVFLTSWLTYVAAGIIQTKQQLLSADEAMALFKEITKIIIYLTVTVVTWWFGDRRVGKYLYRLNDGNLREK